jgi:hypothetical protein
MHDLTQRTFVSTVHKTRVHRAKLLIYRLRQNYMWPLSNRKFECRYICLYLEYRQNPVRLRVIYIDTNFALADTKYSGRQILKSFDFCRPTDFVSSDQNFVFRVNGTTARGQMYEDRTSEDQTSENRTSEDRIL